MPIREEVFLVADTLREERIRVSVRNVRERLRRGGSFSDVGPLVAEWKAARSYQPRIEAAVLTERLQGLLLAFGREVWEEAMREAGTRLRAEHERLDAERRAFLSVADEALARADVLEQRVRELERERDKAR